MRAIHSMDHHLQVACVTLASDIEADLKRRINAPRGGMAAADLALATLQRLAAGDIIATLAKGTLDGLVTLYGDQAAAFLASHRDQLRTIVSDKVWGYLADLARSMEGHPVFGPVVKGAATKAPAAE